MKYILLLMLMSPLYLSGMDGTYHPSASPKHKNQETPKQSKMAIKFLLSDEIPLGAPFLSDEDRENISAKPKQHEQKIYACDKCKKTFSYDGLRVHIRAQHTNTRWRCDQCPKVYKYQNALRDHKEKVHLGIIYLCNHCNKRYKSRAGLHVHKKKCG